MKKQPVKKAKKKKRSNAGRKLFDGKSEALVVKKLEEAFALGCTDEEACFYADISRTAMFEYGQKKPEFLNRKEQLKMKPIFLARKTIIENLNNPVYAFKYLERKKADEFAVKPPSFFEEIDRPDPLTEERKKQIAEAMEAWRG